MAQDLRQFELILIGPTGYTGQFIAEWISTRLPEDLKWAIAGRNAKKLQNVVDELTKLSPNRKQPDIETCELTKEQLVPLVKKARLVITAVGPYMLYGEPVVAACAETGTHYLDCTGEVPWIYDMVEKYDEIAKKNGAIIIPECGYDSVPADLTTFAVVNYIRKTLGAGTEKLILSLYAIKTGVSGGTSLTMLQIFENYSLKHLGKSMHPYSLSPVKPNKPAKVPKGSLFYRLLGLLSLPELGGTQTVGLMASVDTCIVHRSWGLYEASAKATPRPELSYGSRFRFVEYMRARNIIHGLVVKLGLTFTSFMLVFPPTRWIFAPILRNFVIPKPGQGPSRDSLKKDFVTFKAMGIADNEKKDKVIGRLDCAHGAYSLTGLTLAAAAHVILRGRLEETEAGRRGGGLLTPATLGEQYLEKLDEYGFKISVGK